MPALTMKETPRPASTATEETLEEQTRRCAYELYEARGRETARNLKTGFEPESASLEMRQAVRQHRAAAH